MKLLNCEVHNFGSYKHLEFDFADKGLSLVYGPTGTGKSSLCDTAIWVLFGQTAKNGNVDEVRSWQAAEEPTTGNIKIELKDKILTVFRIRGKSTENDLYWIEYPADFTKAFLSQQMRGKDINETQKLLNQRLGVDANLYLSAAYFCEFSPTGSFFVAKAKDRRELFETIADLEFPALLSERFTAVKKDLKKQVAEQASKKDKSQASVQFLKDRLDANKLQIKKWAVEHQVEKCLLQRNYDDFEAHKERDIKELSDKIYRRSTSIKPESYFKQEKDKINTKLAAIKTRCNECGAPKESKEYQALKVAADDIAAAEYDNKVLLALIKSDKAQLDRTAAFENNYGAQLERTKDKANPFVPIDEELTIELDIGKLSEEQHQLELDKLTKTLAYADKLYDLSSVLRAELLKKSIKEIETATNVYLETFFDSELRVSFTIDDNDELQIAICKSGYDCVYRQLSKGQRGLLKLCFSVSVMAASANKAGVHFDNLFLDEALDGLDESLKVKAFSLFEHLAKDKSSIFLVEHSQEFQQLFTNKYKVSLNGDFSGIEHEE